MGRVDGRSLDDEIYKGEYWIGDIIYEKILFCWQVCQTNPALLSNADHGPVRILLLNNYRILYCRHSSAFCLFVCLAVYACAGVVLSA